MELFAGVFGSVKFNLDRVPPPKKTLSDAEGGGASASLQFFLANECRGSMFFRAMVEVRAVNYSRLIQNDVVAVDHIDEYDKQGQMERPFIN